MASPNKRTRSSTREDDEDEEAHPKKEIDLLNKEPERHEEAETDEDDAKHEQEEAEQDETVASELVISETESEAEDANQDGESSFPRNSFRGITPEEEKAREDQDDMATASFATGHCMILRDPYEALNEQYMKSETESDDDDEDSDDDETGSSDDDTGSSDDEIHSSDEEIDLEDNEAEHDDDDVNQEEEDDDLEKILASEVERERARKRKMESEEEDDSELTLSLLSRWETPLKPPENIVQRRLIEQCSRPIRKQLTVSDVSGGEEQSRLALSKSQVDKKFAHLLGESRGKGGIRVSVYGPDGKVDEMKMCADEDSCYLAAGWRKFVGDYELREFCDFVTIWMFRHRDAQQICLAIETKRLSLTKQVSKRISEAAFEDSD